MLTKIIDALNKRSDLAGWTVRHLIHHGAQVYAVPNQTEAQRTAGIEQYKVDILRHTSSADGGEAVGSGNATLLPGGDIESAIEKAVLAAGLVANPVYTIPAPQPVPDVALIDTDIQKDAAAVTRATMERIQSSASRHPGVKLTAAECFGEIETTRLVNSRGIEAEQEATRIAIEFVLHSQRGEDEKETFTEIRRRRNTDLNIEQVMEQQARHTLDLFEAQAPPAWQGPVVLQGNVLATFLAGDSQHGGVLHTLGSAEAKYAKYSSWEIGKSVFRTDVKGDPLTVWANRKIPYGTYSNSFDEEGLPAQRIEFIQNNELRAFSASQRYADYLGIPPTGAFGGVELPPGQTDLSTLLEEPYVEIIQFSWFSPDFVTGDFAAEIRMGYIVENGIRKPFRGGQLIGNFLDALANVCWSAETGFYGNYLGPQVARFNDLKLAG